MSDVNEVDVVENKAKIIELMKSSKRVGMDNLLRFLESTDFFTAPASTRFHESFVGGLAYHSIKVFETMDMLGRLLLTEAEYEELKGSIIIMALMHDICKTGCYKVEQANKKVDGKWVSYDRFTYADDMPLANHGPKSVIILQRFIGLTGFEIMGISWHSGGFGLSPNDSSSCMKAMEKSPLVWMLHTADMMSVAGYDRAKETVERFFSQPIQDAE